MSVVFYPFIFTGEELRYDYGFPHAEWRRNPEAPGTKSNIEAANFKNKMSRKVNEPFLTVTRKKKLETLFKQTRHEKEKPDDSEKRVASTTQREGKESEVPVEVVSKLHPTLGAKNLTIPLQPVSRTEHGISTNSSQNKSSKVEKNKPTGTEEKAPNPLRKDGGTEPEISTKSSQNQFSKVEKTNLLAQKRKLLTRYAKMGARNLGSQQNQRKTNLAKLRSKTLPTQQ